MGKSWQSGNDSKELDGVVMRKTTDLVEWEKGTDLVK